MFIYYRRFLENIQFSWNTQIKKEDKERDRHSSTIAGVKKKKTSIHVRRVEVGPPFGVFFQKTCGRSFPVWNPLSTRPKIVIVPCACLFYYTGDSSYAADGRGCCFIYLDRLAQTKNLPPLLLLLLLYLWSAHDRAVAYKIVYSLFFIQFHSVALSWQPIITLYGGLVVVILTQKKETLENLVRSVMRLAQFGSYCWRDDDRCGHIDFRVMSQITNTRRRRRKGVG
jgi:hypothetical protein